MDALVIIHFVLISAAIGALTEFTKRVAAIPPWRPGKRVITLLKTCLPFAIALLWFWCSPGPFQSTASNFGAEPSGWAFVVVVVAASCASLVYMAVKRFWRAKGK